MLGETLVYQEAMFETPVMVAVSEVSEHPSGRYMPHVYPSVIKGVMWGSGRTPHVVLAQPGPVDTDELCRPSMLTEPIGRLFPERRPGDSLSIQLPSPGPVLWMKTPEIRIEGGRGGGAGVMVGVGVIVGVGETVEVGVCDGVIVGVRVGVYVAVGIGIFVGVGVLVGVRVDVGVRVGVYEGVSVGVWDGVDEGADVGVRVGVRD